MLITQSDLKELLNYDCKTGIFTWSKNRRGVIVNKPLGTDNGYGYLRITVLGKSYYAHRLAWLYVHGEMPKEQIDHINCNKSDNRICNLREVTAKENQHYKKNAQKNSKSKVLGVSWHSKANKWQVHFMNKYVGIFNSIQDATIAYKKAKEIS